MKFFKYLVLPVLLLCSCSKIDLRTSGGCPGIEVFAVNVAVPGPGTLTKAAIDGDGSGEHADRCRLQVWKDDSLKYDRTVAVDGLKATFDDVFLRDADDAMFLFWADNAAGDYYLTDTLTRVRLDRPYMGCDDARDAFCRSLTGAELRDLDGAPVMLERPFGQVNVITTDIGSLYDRLNDDSRSMFDCIVPDSVTLQFRMPSTYDVATCEASDTVSVRYDSPLYTRALSKRPGDLNTISMDYIFASDAEATLKDFSLVLHGDDIQDISRVFTNVPIRRNWRTNIMGDILTGMTSFKVTVAEDWDGEL